MFFSFTPNGLWLYGMGGWLFSWVAHNFHVKELPFGEYGMGLAEEMERKLCFPQPEKPDGTHGGAG